MDDKKKEIDFGQIKRLTIDEFLVEANQKDGSNNTYKPTLDDITEEELSLFRAVY